MNSSLRWIVTLLAAIAVLVVGRQAQHVEAAAVADLPVAFEICTPEGAAAVEKCQAFGLPPTYQVPLGRRLIVEQVSGDCASDATENGRQGRVSIEARTNGTDASHLITLEARPDLPAGEIPLTLTRIYADAGSTVTMGLTQVPAFGNRSCRAVFSGQLVKQ
jgi:hypothetical protein